MGHSRPNPPSSPCHPLLLWSPRPCWDSAPSWSPLVFPMQLTWGTTWSLSKLGLRRLVSFHISRWSGLWRMYCALISHAGKLLSNFKPLTHQFRQGASPPLGRQGDSNLLEISQRWICLWNVLKLRGFQVLWWTLIADEKCWAMALGCLGVPQNCLPTWKRGVNRTHARHGLVIQSMHKPSWCETLGGRCHSSSFGGIQGNRVGGA